MKPAVAAALLLAAYPLLGCRQVLDVDDFGTKATQRTYTGKIDGHAYASLSCRDCVDEHCEEPAASCAADPRCAARARCLALCSVTDHDCRGRCNVSTPSSDAMVALIACQAEHCGGSLPQADQCGGSLALHGNASCDECLANNCPLKLESFSRNLAALGYERCHEVCTCHGECLDGAPKCPLGGATSNPCDPDEETRRLVNELATCCAGQCSETVPDWSCVGRVVSPVQTTRPLELNLRVTLPDTEGPISDLSVQSCSDLTGACKPETPATTNTDGWTTLVISKPETATIYFGHLRVTSKTEDDLPALFYFFPPVRETPTWIARRMVSRSVANITLRDVPDVIPDWDTKGGIVFSARSCNTAAQGLRVISKSGLPVLYFAEGPPVVDPTAIETSSRGYGFLANVPEGRHELEARRANDTLVGRYSVLVERGSLTHLVIEPTEL
jgi:hypothetical protein